MIEFVVRVHTRNIMNASFGNTRAAALAQARTDRLHRDTARAETLAALRRTGTHPADLVPCVVTLTRLSAGRLDRHDGLPSALKRVVDGIALALGIDDGGLFVSWRYEQQKVKPGLHGVHVRIERRQAAVAAGGA